MDGETKMDYIGKQYMSSDGFIMTIVACMDNRQVTVRFEDGKEKICYLHNVINGKTSYHSLGENMKIKSAKIAASFKDKMAEIDPNIEILGDYKDAHTKIHVRCKTCGYEWYPTPGNLIRHHGCRKCRNEKMKISNDEFIKRQEKINPELTFLTEYDGYNSKITAEFPCGHKITMNACNFREKKECKICSRKLKYKDEDGNEFATIKELCNFHNTSRTSYYNNINLGYEGENRYKKRGLHTKPCTDHLGNEFHSIKDMCDFHNIRRSTYVSRIKHGYSIEEALSPENICTYKYEDHLGNKFRSLRDMCNTHNISYYTYRRLSAKGYTLKEILTSNKKYNSDCTDHLGNIFENTQAMCDAYNIGYGTYKSRMNYGWDIEKALTTPVRKRSSK